jgi:hypothetical protein
VNDHAHRFGKAAFLTLLLRGHLHGPLGDYRTLELDAL